MVASFGRLWTETSSACGVCSTRSLKELMTTQPDVFESQLGSASGSCDRRNRFSPRGSLGNALCLIDSAADCGVDVVKFQTHIAEAES